MIKRILCIGILFALLLSGCVFNRPEPQPVPPPPGSPPAVNTPPKDSPPAKQPVAFMAKNLMDGVTAADIAAVTVDDPFITAAANFSVELFKNSFSQDGNSLISPVSVLLALAMTANGADGTTLSQMEAVLGGGLNIGQLNEYLYSYVKSLPSEEKSKLDIANSIWFREDNFTVEQNFLQKNADYYGADAFKAAFDESTVDDINFWVSENTDGLIEKILEEIPDAAIMYLINTILFDAEWASCYGGASDGQFTDVLGAKQNVQFMYASEYQYLEDDNATGFIKPYFGDKYSFAAILPNENLSIGEYVASLSGEKFESLVSNAMGEKTSTALPKFEYEYEIVMNDLLKDMGITDAFSQGTADFTKIGSAEAGNIYIGEVLHKTFITVDESGTKAAAATSVGMEAQSAPTRQVILDRPFLYAIIDNTTNLPLFMGTVLTF